MSLELELGRRESERKAPTSDWPYWKRDCRIKNCYSGKANMFFKHSAILMQYS